MIKYPQVKESTQRIIMIIGKLYQLGLVDLDYSDSIKLYCEIIPDNRKHLKVKIWLTKDNQLLIYEDINGGLEHKEFVSDIGNYLEIVGDLDLGSIRIEKWGHKTKEYKVKEREKKLEDSCFSCYYRSHYGFCNLLKNWHPKKENNVSCAYWTKREELVI